MKNKKSPLNFFPGSAGSILGPGMAMAPGKPMIRGAVDAVRALRNKRRLELEQNTAQVDPTVGVDPTVTPQVNPNVGVDPNVANLGVPGMFNPSAMSAMGGIFGGLGARQASLGASGIYALKKHLSPLNNDDEEPLYSESDWRRVYSVPDSVIEGQEYPGQHGVIIKKSKSLNAGKGLTPNEKDKVFETKDPEGYFYDRDN
tara:strand:+ start:5183 stop:5785 length:603 start_codon:yes stop_codon:yes gene_type:complete